MSDPRTHYPAEVPPGTDESLSRFGPWTSRRNITILLIVVGVFLGGLLVWALTTKPWGNATQYNSIEEVKAVLGNEGIECGEYEGVMQPGWVGACTFAMPDTPATASVVIYKDPGLAHDRYLRCYNDPPNEPPLFYDSGQNWTVTVTGLAPGPGDALVDADVARRIAELLGTEVNGC